MQSCYQRRKDLPLLLMEAANPAEEHLETCQLQNRQNASRQDSTTADVLIYRIGQYF